jgi:excisionase family DNA binding protein
MPEKLYKLPEVWRILGICARTGHALIKAGTLPTVRVGRQHRVSKSALSDWIAAGGTPHKSSRADDQRYAPAEGAVTG